MAGARSTEMRLIVSALLLALAACGSGATAPSAATTRPTTSPTSAGPASIGQVVHGPGAVDLTVLRVRIDPPGDGFPLAVPGRWISVQMTIHDDGSQTFAPTTMDLLMDLQVRDQQGTDYPASGTADGDQQVGAPVLSGETSTGWMRFAVPAAGPLRLIWKSAQREVTLTTS